MSAKILCVDDEPNVLSAYQRQLRKQFNLEVAGGGELGLAVVAERGPFAVIVSDMLMPGMSGSQFLARVRQLAPDSVRILLTGYANQQSAIEAVNDGQIFRFLTKPCSPEVLVKALEAGVQQYQLVTAEKELLEKTLRGSVQVLTEVLALVNPTAFGRATRVRRLVCDLAQALQAPNAWQFELTALFSQIGCVTVPEPVLAKVYQGTDVGAEDWAMFEAHAQTGRDLIGKIPRLEAVAEAIALQERRFDGTNTPAGGPAGTALPLAARVLKVALDFDNLESLGHPRRHVLGRLRHRRGWYDPTVLDALETILGPEDTRATQMVRLSELTCRMILVDNIVTHNGLVIVGKGQEITPTLLQRLRNFSAHSSIHEPIQVVVPATTPGP